MTLDTRTEAERDYDALKDGSAYAKPTPPAAGSDTVWAPILDILDDPLNDGKPHEDDHLEIARLADRLLAEQQTDDEDTPLSPEEEEIIGVLFGKPVIFVPSRDEAHRQERLNRILDHIADLPEPAQSEAIRFMEGLLDGMEIGHMVLADEDASVTTLLKDVETYYETKRKPAGLPDPQPFGTLADGTVITGSFDGKGRSGCVNITTDTWMLTADDEGYFSGENQGEEDAPIQFDGMSMADVVALRALVLSDTFDRLLTAANAWGRGDTEPPTFAPAVTLTKKDDHGNESDVDDNWLVYAVEGVHLSIEDHKPAALFAFGNTHDLDVDDVSDLRRLYTLLSDPRVQRWIGLASDAA